MHESWKLCIGMYLFLFFIIEIIKNNNKEPQMRIIINRCKRILLLVRQQLNNSIFFSPTIALDLEGLIKIWTINKKRFLFYALFVYAIEGTVNCKNLQVNSSKILNIA